jgi:hypothetical protein
MLFRNSGMHMQNIMMSHEQLSVATGWTILGSNPGRTKIFSCFQRPDRLRVPLTFLWNGVLVLSYG